jgi:hypothetical protein
MFTKWRNPIKLSLPLFHAFGGGRGELRYTSAGSLIAALLRGRGCHEIKIRNLIIANKVNPHVKIINVIGRYISQKSSQKFFIPLSQLVYF